MDGDIPPRSRFAPRLTTGSTVGRKLKVARTELQATEDFVAAALGLSTEAYRRVEAGTAQLSPGHVIQAAQLFGLQPSALCIDTEPPGPAGAAEALPQEPAAVIQLAAFRQKRQP